MDAAADLLEPLSMRVRFAIDLGVHPDAYDELVRWKRAITPTEPTHVSSVFEQTPRRDHEKREARMAVARVTEISSTSTVSFEDAIKSGISRANQTLRNVKSAWIKEQQVRLDEGSITEYQVNMLVTFILDD